MRLRLRIDSDVPGCGLAAACLKCTGAAASRVGGRHGGLVVVTGDDEIAPSVLENPSALMYDAGRTVTSGTRARSTTRVRRIWYCTGVIETLGHRNEHDPLQSAESISTVEGAACAKQWVR